MKFVNIGFGNIVISSRIVSVISPDSAPVKRIIKDAEERNKLINATFGRKTRAVIITDSDHIILSALQPETLSVRITEEEENDG